MHKSTTLQEFERRLEGLGCPRRHLARYVEELAGHHADLKRAALEQGFAEAEAEAYASRLLGEPVELAEQCAAELRQSSWFGRHRVMSFCVFPPLAVFAASILALASVLTLLKVCFSADHWRILSDLGDGLNPIALTVKGSWYVSIAAVTLLFCRLARRSGAGLGWQLAACGVCSLQSLFGFCRVIPHSTTIGYSASINWCGPLIPLLIGAFIYATQRRAERDHESIPNVDGRIS